MRLSPQMMKEKNHLDQSRDEDGHGSDPPDADAPDRFDVIVSRRRALGLGGVGGVLAALTALGAGPWAALRGLFGRGLVPVVWAQEAEAEEGIAGKPEMTVHSPHPINGELAPHLLDDDVTPTERHFVRNNGGVPQRARARDPEGWTLTVDGEVEHPLSLTLDELKAMPSVSMPLLIECGGNGRALFDPPVRGNPWQRGAVGCSEWTGVPLESILERAGLKSSAVYTAHYGEDPGIGSNPPFSRGIPIEKALDEHTLVAYAMNGEPLPPLHGYPVRLIVPGWIGSCSQKWLNRIRIRDQVHDSKKMTGFSYRVPAHPVIPGTKPAESEMEIATAWIVKSLTTRPAAHSRHRVGEPVAVAGHAWAGERMVAKVLISTDYGVHWKEARLTSPPNRYAWSRWQTEITFPRRGYYEIWARAVDDQGEAQPFRQPWNPKGYLGNVIHRLPVVVLG